MVSVATPPAVEAPPDPAAPSSVVLRLWRLPLWAHLLVYAAVLASLLVAGSRASWSSDDGAYALQAATVRETGDWHLSHRFQAVDPDGRHFPLVNSTVAEGRFYPYVKHPSWIAVLVGSTRVLGPELGLFVPSALAALAAAVSAWKLATALVPRAARSAFWLAGTGPLLIHAEGLWAHAASAALGGLACLAVVRIAQRGPSLGRGLTLGVVLAGGLLVRSEGLLFTAVTLAVVGVVLGWPRRVPRLTAIGATVLPAVLLVSLAAVVQGWWRAAIAPGAESSIGLRRGEVDWWAGRFTGAFASLLQGGDRSATAALGVTAVTLLVLAVLMVRRRQSCPTAAVVLGAGAAVVLVARIAVGPSELASGLLTAWPVATAGALVWRWAPASIAERSLAGIIGGFGLGVVLTQYPEGGGLEWGGRYFSPVLVPMAVLASAGLTRLAGGQEPRDAVPRWARVAGSAALAATIVLPPVLGVLSTERLRHRQEVAIGAALDAGADPIVSLNPYRPRTAWRTPPDRWLVADRRSIESLLDRLRQSGTGSVTVTGPGASAVDTPGYRRRILSPDLVVLEAL